MRTRRIARIGWVHGRGSIGIDGDVAGFERDAVGVDGVGGAVVMAVMLLVVMLLIVVVVMAVVVMAGVLMVHGTGVVQMIAREMQLSSNGQGDKKSDGVGRGQNGEPTAINQRRKQGQADKGNPKRKTATAPGDGRVKNGGIDGGDEAAETDQA